MDELADSRALATDPAALRARLARATIRRILGPGAFSYPVKVLRAVAPESLADRTTGRYVHCDYAGAGVQDMLTTWIPLADVPVELGGLAVRPGGHRERPRQPRLLPDMERTCRILAIT